MLASDDPKDALLKACAAVGFEQLTLRLGTTHEQLNAWLAGVEPIPKDKVHQLAGILVPKRLS